MFPLPWLSQNLGMNEKKEHSSGVIGQDLNLPLTTWMTLRLLLKYYEYTLLNFLQIELLYVAESKSESCSVVVNSLWS